MLRHLWLKYRRVRWRGRSREVMSHHRRDCHGPQCLTESRSVSAAGWGLKRLRALARDRDLKMDRSHRELIRLEPNQHRVSSNRELIRLDLSHGQNHVQSQDAPIQ